MDKTEIIIAADCVSEEYFTKSKISYKDARNWRNDNPIDDNHISKADDDILRDEITRFEICRQNRLYGAYKYFDEVLFKVYPDLKKHYFQVLVDNEKTLGKYKARTAAVNEIVRRFDSLPKSGNLHRLLGIYIKHNAMDITDVEKFRENNTYHLSWLAKLDRPRLEDNVAFIRLSQLRSIGNLNGIRKFINRMRELYPDEFRNILNSNSRSIEPMRTKNVIKRLNELKVLENEKKNVTNEVKDKMSIGAGKR